MLERTTQSVVLIGASNLALAFPLAVHGLTRGLTGPLEIFGALGHGRALGSWSRVAYRDLPGLVDCGLWRALDRLDGRGPPPLALLADIGNDLMYGAEVDRMLGWLDACLERLRSVRARIVLQSLPLASVARLTPGLFGVLRPLLFPGSRMTWPQLRQRLAALDTGMRVLGRRYEVHWVEAAAEWYGIDPIHIRPDYQAQAMATLFSGWPAWDPAARVEAPSWPRAWALRRLRPAERYLFGRRQVTAQPVAEYSGSRIFLF